jgi:hypothetical protein
VFNIGAYIVVKRLDWHVDITDTDLFEIDKTTADYLEKLSSKVTVYVTIEEELFRAQGDYYYQTNEIINRFGSAGENISVKYVNLDRTPDFNAGFGGGIINPGDLLVKDETTGKFRRIQPGQYLNITYYQVYYDGSLQQLSEAEAKSIQLAGGQVVESAAGASEQALLSAIMTVTDPDPVKVAFDYSFGEGFIALENLDGLSDWLYELLEKNAYEMSVTDLANGDIDPDIDFLVIFAPTTDFTKSAADKVRKWLAHEGAGTDEKTLFYCASIETTEVNTPNIDALLKEYAIEVEKKMLIQTNTDYGYSDGTIQLIQFGEEGRYTSEIPANGSVPFIGAPSRPVSILPYDSTAIAVSELLRTYDGAIAADLSVTDPQEAIDSGAVKKIYTIGLETRKTHGDYVSRVIAFGSSIQFYEDFCANSYYSNGQFALNVFREISGKDVSVSIIPKDINAAKAVQFSVTARNARILNIVLVWCLPLAVIAVGVTIFVRRRFK